MLEIEAREYVLFSFLPPRFSLCFGCVSLVVLGGWMWTEQIACSFGCFDLKVFVFFVGELVSVLSVLSVSACSSLLSCGELFASSECDDPFSQFPVW